MPSEDTYFKPGNQISVGNDGGRPRTVSLPEEEMIALGKEMIEWVKKHNPLHLSEWYKIEKMIIYKVWKTYIQRPEFIPYYEQALAIIGKQYLDKNSNVRDGISNRWQRLYFSDLKDKEDEDKQDDSNRELEQKKASIEFEINKKSSTTTPEQNLELSTALSLVGYLQNEISKKEAKSENNDQRE